MLDSPSFDNLNVQEVLELVESGKYTPEEAIEIERQGKGRRTLIEALERLKISSQDDASQESADKSKAKKITVTLLKNIKYKGQRYKIGETIEINEEYYDRFIAAKIIEGD